ncbi:MAG: hypothetical protein DCF25_22250 [Leptolyngbya foveolarum]|uniref:Uncharacterized protein n=1 Tax=Leptolyngbya foveolarum TaxID=47253 RepID=A0A2W4TLE4_9CYAN|nr:MAG: hypothetical protein DCF25_22250 [Leptolyngbya foveolarum]
MPTQVVKPITAETFRPYAKLGKSNGKVQSRICALLLRLIQTDDPAKVKNLCSSEVAWLETEYSNPNTRTSAASRIKVRAGNNVVGRRVG